MNFFLLTLFLNQIPVKKALSDFTFRLSLKGIDFNNYLKNKKWDIFDYHKKNNPFYFNLLGNKHITNWNDIPILSKSNFQFSNTDFLTPTIDKRDMIFGKTSGSSGIPLKYARDKYCHALLWANIISEYRNLGIEYGKSKQARFYGIPLEGFSYYREILKDKLLNRDRFVVYDLSDIVLKTFLERFRNNYYDYIYGYTNSIVLFARYLKKNNIILKDISKGLKLCIVTSEVCTYSDKIFLEEVLGVKVYNEYGSSEAAIIAFDNSFGDWLLNDPLLHIEFVDENGKEVIAGEMGRILVTSLDNRAMPLIRYEVGDCGTLSERVSGDRRILKHLDGRLNDNLKLPNGKIVPGFTLYYTTKALMDSVPGLKEYNIQQLTIDHLNFDLVIDKNYPIFENQIENELLRLVTKYLNVNMKISFKIVDKLDRSKSGKAKHFVSLID